MLVGVAGLTLGVALAATARGGRILRGTRADPVRGPRLGRPGVTPGQAGRRPAAVTLELVTTGDPRALAAHGVAGAPRVAVPAEAQRLDRAGVERRVVRPGPRAGARSAVARRSAGAAGARLRIAGALARRRVAAASRCSPTSRRHCSGRRRGGSARPAWCGPGCAMRPAVLPGRRARSAARTGRRRHERPRPGAGRAVPGRRADPPGRRQRHELLDRGRRRAARAAAGAGASVAVRGAWAASCWWPSSSSRGPSPSVLRAAVMASIALVCLATGRPRAGVPMLAATVLGLLIWDPALGGDAGFTMSVLATAALLLLAPGWAAALRRRRVPARAWPRPSRSPRRPTWSPRR